MEKERKEGGADAAVKSRASDRERGGERVDDDDDG